MTSLLSECEHERDELYARVRELERDLDKVAANHVVMLTRLSKERDEARGQFAHERDFRLAAMRRAERAEADAARLREALRKTLEVVEGETCGECGVECEACECDGSAWWRRARAALAGEQETNKGEP